MTPTFIALDMDGVVADFSMGVEQLVGIPGFARQLDAERSNPHAGENLLTDAHWAQIQAAGPNWWATLPSLSQRFPSCPTAKELYDWAVKRVGRGNVAFVTAIGGETAEAAAAGKLRWLRHQLVDPTFLDVVLTKAAFKHHLAHKKAFLIDDHPKNCERWRERGYAFQYDARVIQSFSFVRPWSDVLDMAIGDPS